MIDTEPTSTISPDQFQQQLTTDDVSYRQQDGTRREASVDKDDTTMLEQQMKSRQSTLSVFLYSNHETTTWRSMRVIWKTY